MSLIEQATKRLEELTRAGVAVPWAAASVGHGKAADHVDDALVRDAHGVSQPQAFRGRRDMAGDAVRTQSDHVDSDAPGRPTPGSSPLVALNLDWIRGTGLLVPTLTRSPLAEEFRRIKRPLLENALNRDSTDGRRSLVMITSALPSEGKTTCAINLAMSMAAEMDVSVLLVDADVVRPDLPERLGIEAARGLMDVLADSELDLPDVLLAFS